MQNKISAGGVLSFQTDSPELASLGLSSVVGIGTTLAGVKMGFSAGKSIVGGILAFLLILALGYMLTKK